MKLFLLCLFLLSSVFVFSGCEHLGESVRQTGKNANALFFEGYQKDLYSAR